MNNDELIEYAIRTSKVIKEEIKPKLIDYFYKQREVINKAIELLNNPWSFESGNKEVDEITYNKKRKVIDILKEVSE